MTEIQDGDLADRTRYRQWTRDVLRYCDTDRQGHVNNAVFATFCESGRVAFLCPPGAPLAPPGRTFVIARLELDFRGEIRWPGAVDIGTTVLAIGRSSFTLGQGLFVDQACVATARTVIVMTDEETRRSAPLPEATRAALAAIAAGECG